MPRYFFDFENGTNAYPDDEGSELPDNEAARVEGATTIAEMAKSFLPVSSPQKNIALRVRNESGQPVLQMSLTFAIQPLA